MGKAFDDLGEGAAQRKWHEAWLTEAYRVLRPGGVIKAFNGTRTFHHMAYAMQEAGFVDLRVESWNYGCLSEDTEVLTRNGWEHYHRATVGTEIMGFDPMTEDFRWMPVEDTYEYAYDREAYRLVGEGSDHIVSTNHRCLVERDGEWSFVYAEQLEDTEAVPCVSFQGARYSVAHLERSTVRVERIDYKGMVWCVKVPTGAFVARRNGMAFVTGNSGFPKSTNIGKKLAQYEDAQASDPFWLESNTDAAKGSERFRNWGTALKPAFEPVIVATKPKDC